LEARIVEFCETGSRLGPWNPFRGDSGRMTDKVQMTALKKAGTVAQEALLESTSVANVLARRLNDAIAGGDFVVGSSLPSERELMIKYRVSRATVREALRVLRAHDLIQVKRGRSGGSFISSPTSDSVVRSLNHFIKGQNLRFIDLALAREAIEPAAAAQAAISRTKEKLHALWLQCIECERHVTDIDRFVEVNLEWHLALAEASGNPLFVAFLTSLYTALHTATNLEEFDIRIRKAVVGVHWQIYEAIRIGDPDAARRRMARHLAAYSQQLSTINLSAKID
jgi:GntR family transcriptional repressor for pyruvate dehydrogenase complex